MRVRLVGIVALAAALGTSTFAVDAPAEEEGTAVTVSRDGFRPRSLRARKGETIRLSVRSTDGEHCFALDALRVEKRVTPGRATAIEVTADREGTFEIRCCLGAEHEQEPDGSLVVAE